jgi:hypothetical protein
MVFMKKQLFVDNYTLLHLARGVKARQAVLDRAGPIAEANAAFDECAVVSYESAVDREFDLGLGGLEDNPSLNELLILLLEADLRVKELKRKKIKEGLPQAIIERDDFWERYEVMRRIMAFDHTSLVVRKS